MEPAVDDGLVEAVMAASRVLVAMAARSIEASPSDVTLTQYRALVVMAAAGSLHMSDLSRELALSPSSTTRLVERLERKGLVARGPSPSSRRSVSVGLEPRGEELVATVMEERRRILEELLTGVSSEDQVLMRRAFEALAKLSGEPVAAPPILLGRPSLAPTAG